MPAIEERAPSSPLPPEFDVIVVGAGFAGLYLLHRLREQGMRVRVYERGLGVGGTWYWNRYPGARCDVESMDYAYSFSPELQQEWTWTERYPTQPEILRYLEHVADRFDLLRDVQLATTVTQARFDGESDRWQVTTDGGEHVTARFCVMASGNLSEARVPPFEGLESFGGTVHHTSDWPESGVDFGRKRVGVIGTGSSGIQSIPIIAKQAGHLFVFQRTPHFSVPARNAPLDPAFVTWMKENYVEHKRKARGSTSGVPWRTSQMSALEVSDEERLAEYDARWQEGGAAFLAAYRDLLTDRAANETAAEYVRQRIRELVHDPSVAELLVPQDYAIGTKRLCVDTEYYDTFNRPNVTLVDVRSAPIERITETGLQTAGAHIELDSLVFATGFDAMTGALMRIDIRGRDGRTLQDKWADGPLTYLGLMTAGFPNLFMVTGPGSPSVLSNMVVSIEQHVEWISECLAHLRAHDFNVIEPTKEAEDAWVHHVNEVADHTLYPAAPSSWYLGSNVPGKPRVFMPYVGGVGPYRRICDEVVRRGYEGLELGAALPDGDQAPRDEDVDRVLAGADDEPRGFSWG